MRTHEPRNQENREIQAAFGLPIGVGVVMMILGVIALSFPLFFTSVAVELLFGWLFLFGGIVQLIYAFQSSSAGRVIFKLLGSIITLIAGFIMLTNPLAGVLTLTLVLGISIFSDGVLRVIQAFQIKPLAGWGLFLFNGILEIILGIFIWSQWPLDAAWVLGLFVGLSIFFNGLAVLMFSLAVRDSLRV